MDTNSFISNVLSELNSFRGDPSTVVKKCEKVKTAFSRLNKTDPFLKEIDQFIASVRTTSKMQNLSINNLLSKAAEAYLDSFLMGNESTKYLEGNSLEGLLTNISGFTSSYLIVDDGAEKPEDVIVKILLNKTDKEKNGRKVILNNLLSCVGIAHGIRDDENLVVLIFTDGAMAKKKMQINYRSKMDLTLLKQAFDLYDTQKKGLIDPEEAYKGMQIIGFDKSNPILFEIVAELNTPENHESKINFDTFAGLICQRLEERDTEEGLKRMFDLFIDDPSPKADSINLAKLKKICQDLDIHIPEADLVSILEKTSLNGKEHVFKEFYELMMNKAGY